VSVPLITNFSPKFIIRISTYQGENGKFLIISSSIYGTQESFLPKSAPNRLLKRTTHPLDRKWWYAVYMHTKFGLRLENTRHISLMFIPEEGKFKLL